MCFGGGSAKIPEVQTPEVAEVPTPAPVPTSVEPREVTAQNATARRDQLRAARRGFVSTIKSSARGISGEGISGADNTKKTTLGG